MKRVMIVGGVLAALAACSTEGRLLAPDPEKASILSPEARTPAARVGEVDPVCGAHLDPAEVHWTTAYAGDEYYFDSEECQREFEANPDRFRATTR